jgi:hypothetical protein
MGNMILDKKVQQQAEWTRQHNLTEVQFKQLLSNKLMRAKDKTIALKLRDSKLFA